MIVKDRLDFVSISLRGNQIGNAGHAAYWTASMDGERDNSSLIARIAALEKERDEMAGWIKAATTTISDAIGGGSEMFIRKGEAYRIDPRFVANYIETRRGDLHEARVTIVKLRKEAKP